MTALHFGDSKSALFGVWTTPPQQASREHGVILCPPIGQEHVRSHWAMRQVATALGRAGFDCLRFDWFGVGDSAGELRDATLARWKTDLASAAQELRDASGVRRISLLGLRFGATVAALAAHDIGPSAVVLWDPVVDGLRYVAELRLLTEQLVSDRHRFWKPLASRNSPRSTELVGFDFGERLLSALEKVAIGSLPQTSLCLIRSGPPTQLQGLAERLRESHPEVEIKGTEIQTKWTSPDEVEELLLPGDAVGIMTRFLEARAG